MWLPLADCHTWLLYSDLQRWLNQKIRAKILVFKPSNQLLCLKKKILTGTRGLFSFSFHLEIGHTAPTQESNSCPDECDDVCEGGEQMEQFLSRALCPYPPVQYLLAPQAEGGEKKTE